MIGGSDGIGLAIAHALSSHGHRVAVTHHTRPAPPSMLSTPCDVTKPDDIEAAFTHTEQAHGPIELLTYAAGTPLSGLVATTPDSDVMHSLDVNYLGAFRCLRRALPSMLCHHYGRIVLVSSGGAVTAMRGASAYTASKTALIALACSTAREVATKGITVNSLLPGLTNARMAHNLTPQQHTALLERTPMGRMITQEEVASTAAFLLSDNASGITGAAVPVDGGLSIRV
ncbi:SDR family NAD(P)-dependent oxidoreductase [Streptomyces sp. NPDC101227]|uniref:SDR family NAD(P)-dependent oxidoreductase n=1 Tax=Streptomyces sp. NPDC101227 TaxID=3366136 RepID=UPI003828F7A7